MDDTTGADGRVIDWRGLRAAACTAMQSAYVPYSRFPVGVAALVDDGRVVTGCNVENASYGLTLCAECGLVSHLALTGGGRLVAFVCVDGAGELLMPCGRCRQLLYEHGGPELVLWTGNGHRTMAQVLPDAFGPHDLDAAAARSQAEAQPEHQPQPEYQPQPEREDQAEPEPHDDRPREIR